jgi:hypothetical protein
VYSFDSESELFDSSGWAYEWFDIVTLNVLKVSSGLSGMFYW